MSTGFVWDERYAAHDTGSDLPTGEHYEPYPCYDTPESKRRIRNLVATSGLLNHLIELTPQVATEADLLRFHTREYVDRVRTLSQNGGGETGEGAHLGAGGFEIALLAVGGCISALDAVLDGTVENAYALVRPCGHHALSDFGMGYSIFSNIALAVLHAKAKRGVGRVAVIDWDVHHGNGTQAAFYRDPTVLTVSVHQDRRYPTNSGALRETGEGAGQGLNINVPLPAGSGHGAYIETLNKVILPALHTFLPELIVVASGFDANGYDPLGQMLCYSHTFRELALGLKSTAQILCDGRLVACHEGGYSAPYVPFCGLVTIEAFAGVRTSVIDPWADRIAAFGGQSLQPHQAEIVRRAEELARGLKNI